MTQIIRKSRVHLPDIAGMENTITIVQEGETPKRVDMRVIINKDGSTGILYLVYDYNNLSIMGTSVLVTALGRYNAITTKPEVG